LVSNADATGTGSSGTTSRPTPAKRLALSFATRSAIFTTAPRADQLDTNVAKNTASQADIAHILVGKKDFHRCDYYVLAATGANGQFCFNDGCQEKNMNAIDLKGRCAVVTGGASGIGFAIAQRFIASGAKVAIWDINAKAAVDASRALDGGEHVGIPVDVTSQESVDAATAATVKEFGRIDILVCSAGITGPNVTTWDYPVAEWRRVMEINVNGVFICNRAVVREMLKRDYGRVINIASIAGKDGNPNASAYSASKAAVIGLTKSIGKEVAKTGVRVNCITPAAVKTAIFDQMTREHIDFMLSKIPMARFGLVEEIAAMVAWLASEECSFSTGATFDVSGGRAVY
jgi:2-dehydro-3-deoxy-L-rhamnonate dehydrogenase (NAD+)